MSDHLAELAEAAGNAERFLPRFRVMMEDVEFQLEAEEERLFPLAEDLCTEEALEELGRQMEAAKGRFLSRRR